MVKKLIYIVLLLNVCALVNCYASYRHSYSHGNISMDFDWGDLPVTGDIKWLGTTGSGQGGVIWPHRGSEQRDIAKSNIEGFLDKHLYDYIAAKGYSTNNFELYTYGVVYGHGDWEWGYPPEGLKLTGMGDNQDRLAVTSFIQNSLHVNLPATMNGKPMIGYIIKRSVDHGPYYTHEVYTTTSTSKSVWSNVTSISESRWRNTLSSLPSLQNVTGLPSIELAKYPHSVGLSGTNTGRQYPSLIGNYAYTQLITGQNLNIKLITRNSTDRNDGGSLLAIGIYGSPPNTPPTVIKTFSTPNNASYNKEAGLDYRAQDSDGDLLLTYAMVERVNPDGSVVELPQNGEGAHMGMYDWGNNYRIEYASHDNPGPIVPGSDTGIVTLRYNPSDYGITPGQKARITVWAEDESGDASNGIQAEVEFNSSDSDPTVRPFNTAYGSISYNDYGGVYFHNIDTDADITEYVINVHPQNMNDVIKEIDKSTVSGGERSRIERRYNNAFSPWKDSGRGPGNYEYRVTTTNAFGEGGEANKKNTKGMRVSYRAYSPLIIRHATTTGRPNTEQHSFAYSTSDMDEDILGYEFHIANKQTGAVIRKWAWNPGQFPPGGELSVSGTGLHNKAGMAQRTFSFTPVDLGMADGSYSAILMVTSRYNSANAMNSWTKNTYDFTIQNSPYVNNTRPQFTVSNVDVNGAVYTRDDGAIFRVEDADGNLNNTVTFTISNLSGSGSYSYTRNFIHNDETHVPGIRIVTNNSNGSDSGTMYVRVNRGDLGWGPGNTRVRVRVSDSSGMVADSEQILNGEATASVAPHFTISNMDVNGADYGKVDGAKFRVEDVDGDLRNTATFTISNLSGSGSYSYTRNYFSEAVYRPRSGIEIIHAGGGSGSNSGTQYVRVRRSSLGWGPGTTRVTVSVSDNASNTASSNVNLYGENQGNAAPRFTVSDVDVNGAGYRRVDGAKFRVEDADGNLNNTATFTISNLSGSGSYSYTRNFIYNDISHTSGIRIITNNGNGSNSGTMYVRVNRGDLGWGPGNTRVRVRVSDSSGMVADSEQILNGEGNAPPPPISPGGPGPDPTPTAPPPRPGPGSGPGPSHSTRPYFTTSNMDKNGAGYRRVDGARFRVEDADGDLRNTATFTISNSSGSGSYSYTRNYFSGAVYRPRPGIEIVHAGGGSGSRSGTQYVRVRRSSLGWGPGTTRVRVSVRDNAGNRASSYVNLYGEADNTAPHFTVSGIQFDRDNYTKEDTAMFRVADVDGNLNNTATFTISNLSGSGSYSYTRNFIYNDITHTSGIRIITNNGNGSNSGTMYVRVNRGDLGWGPGTTRVRVYARDSSRASNSSYVDLVGEALPNRPPYFSTSMVDTSGIGYKDDHGMRLRARDQDGNLSNWVQVTVEDLSMGNGVFKHVTNFSSGTYNPRPGFRVIRKNGSGTSSEVFKVRVNRDELGWGPGDSRVTVEIRDDDGETATTSHIISAVSHDTAVAITSGNEYYNTDEIPLSLSVNDPDGDITQYELTITKSDHLSLEGSVVDAGPARNISIMFTPGEMPPVGSGEGKFYDIVKLPSYGDFYDGTGFSRRNFILKLSDWEWMPGDYEAVLRVTSAHDTSGADFTEVVERHSFVVKNRPPVVSIDKAVSTANRLTTHRGLQDSIEYGSDFDFIVDASDPDGNFSSIRVEYQTADGSWQLISEHAPNIPWSWSQSHTATASRSFNSEMLSPKLDEFGTWNLRASARDHMGVWSSPVYTTVHAYNPLDARIIKAVSVPKEGLEQWFIPSEEAKVGIYVRKHHQSTNTRRYTPGQRRPPPIIVD